MLKDNVEAVLSEINRVCKQKDCSAREITIVAASKTVPVSTLNELPQLGIKIAGENRVQEFLQKKDAVKGLDWHIIGALQTNKVKHVVGSATLIQSLDRKELGDEINKRSAQKGIVSDVLIEVNVGKEFCKSGVLPQHYKQFVDYVYTLKNVRVRGLMSVLPKNANLDLYVQMKQRYDELRKTDQSGFIQYLSMGMSSDYVTAIRQGANMVRLGSALFGARVYAAKKK